MTPTRSPSSPSSSTPASTAPPAEAAPATAPDAHRRSRVGGRSPPALAAAARPETAETPDAENRGAVLDIPLMARFLFAPELQALAAADPALREPFLAESEGRAAAETLIEATVGSAHQLRQRLGPIHAAAGRQIDSVRALPAHLQGEPLVALGAQLLHMPDGDRAQAIRDFLAFPVPEGVHPVLDDLRLAAQAGEAGLVAREAGLVAAGAAAWVAVERGENLRAVSRRLGIGGAQALARLTEVAMPQALAAVERQEPVLDVARRFGITASHDIQAMWVRSVPSLPPTPYRQAAAFDGQRVSPAEGLSSELASAIHQAVAVRRVLHGEDVGHVSQRLGIHASLATAVLQPLAASIAERQLRSGPLNVADLAHRRGITEPALVTRLERLAIDWHAAAMLQQGQPPDALVQQLGIVTPENVHHLLQRAAAPRHA